jgi:phytoene dehydrogenase-like protein
MSKKYDIAVIGGGHNGLTAACTLARKGKKVLVLEKRGVLGGIAAGEEFFPGYKTTGLLHDTSQLGAKVIQELDLEKFGLRTERGRATISILSKEGECIQLYSDVDKSLQEIQKFSKKDAQAYVEYCAFIEKIRPFINGLMHDVPPDLNQLGGKQIWDLAKKGWALKKLGKKTLLEFLKVAPMCVADFLSERFETEFLKAGIAGPAIYGSFTGPWSSYTTLNLLLWECAAREYVPGGPGALISALEKAARNLGVDIHTDAELDKILLNGNKIVKGIKLINGEEIETKIVASSCTPKITFFNFFQPNQIDYSTENGIHHFRSRGTTAKINLAVNRTIKIGGISDVEFARTGNSFVEMERAFDSVKYRKFSEEPILDIHVPSIRDESLAPSGHSVVSILVHFAPHHFDEGWSETTKDRLLQKVIKTLEHYVSGVSSSIVGSEILSPVDIEERYGLTNGQIFHGEHAVDQLITRPIPTCARYHTPIEGLYLCGSGSHPGGGITCMPGYLAAKRILG